MSKSGHFHCDEIKRLSKLSVLDADFFDNIFQYAKINKETILKNLAASLLVDLSYIDAYSYYDDAENISGDVKLSSENFGKILKNIISLRLEVADNKIVNEKLDDFIDACLGFTDFTSQEDGDKAKIIYLLYYNSDSNFLVYDVVNYTLKLFNQFCLSLLKGEYIILDKFSEELFDIEKELRGQKVQKDLREYLKKMPEFDANESASNEELTTVSTIQQKIDWLKGAPNFHNIMLDVMGDLSDSETIPYVAYYADFFDICREYFIYNRKIDTFLESEKHTTKVPNYFDGEQKYQERYEKAYLKFFNSGASSEANLLSISEMLPYLFRKILDMCIIDHNFISSEDNFKVLLSLEELLGGFADGQKNGGFLAILDKLNTYKNISSPVLVDLHKTLRLVDYKNNVLIYKTLKRAAREIEEYQYIGERNVVIFSDQDGAPHRTFEIVRKLKNYICVAKEKNDILKEYDLYESSKGKSKQLQCYENDFLDILDEEVDYQFCLEKYKSLKNNIIAETNFIPEEDRDIQKYNQAIVNNLIEQFIKYGEYIKRLQILGQRQDWNDKKYLKEILYLLQANGHQRILSCSFFRKHLDWSLNRLENKIRKEEANDSSGFEYVRLIHQLLQHFQKLITYIKDDSYCLNFSSLFQNCFYQYTFDSDAKNGEKEGLQKWVLSAISRKEMIGKSQSCFWKKIKDEDVIFISSAWLPPVSILRLEKEYRDFSERADLRSVEFYNNYYDRVFEKQVEQKIGVMNEILDEKMEKTTVQVKDELDDNKRSTVQILGIFAAFLALVTVSIGNLVTAKEHKDYLKMMFSMTICLCVFVMLLHFVVNRKHNRPFVNLFALFSILIMVLFLGGLLFLL